MSIWDKFSGRKPKPSGDTLPAQSNVDPSTGGYASAPPAFDTSSIQDATSFLGSASLPDASQLHPLAGLNQQTLDYLSLDESTLSDLPGAKSILPSRGWSDDLCYGTGVTYLAALTTGGAWGMVEGLNKFPASAPPKLRINGILNSMTRRGPFLGNSAGAVAMLYNGINSTLGYYRGRHDAGNGVVAGALSGMIFKSTRGVRPMLISGSVVASIAGAWAVSISVQSWKPILIHYRLHEKYSSTSQLHEKILYDKPATALHPFIHLLINAFGSKSIRFSPPDFSRLYEQPLYKANHPSR